MKKKYVLRYKYKLLEKFIENSIHELPFGVLYGVDGASIEELEEMKKVLFAFKDLSKKLEKNDDNFIDFCFMIYNVYGDYLEKHKIHYQNEVLITM